MGGFSNIGKTIKKIDPLRGGDVILESAGLPTWTGEGDKNILDMGQAAAKQAAADAAAAQREATRVQQETDALRLANEKTLTEINKNMATDLSTENRTQVVAGGTASVMDAASEDARKRRGLGGLSTTLGINT